ncbi:HD-GYP domain-containing protein [Anaeromicropila herbilytica]|uniref:Phosphodiesterase n=1 Tax=Anaeromicropila herbilytica TaxID=2785025 RepID=A0A7R7EQS5_9FIRM|nr:HD-GYP domain-containing protein [Anaeromicropila herbilytica]BCN32792.1 phosphodiesterase [Anaeromicropila herbilytica]
MRLVSLAMITEEMVLAQPIYYADNLILKEGVTNLNRFTKRLKSLGIDLVYIYDEISDGIEIPDVISNETRATCKRVLQDTVDRFLVEDSMDGEGIVNVADCVIREILQNKDVQLNLNDISSADEYTLAHSVSTTVYALVIAKELNYNKSLMNKLAIGALLHDVGKVALDRNIVFKPDRLTDEEYKHVQLHAQKGYEILKKCNEITELSRIIALTHHERINGAGYPKGLQGSEIHQFSKIVAIADVYDALTSERCYRKKWPAHRAADYLVENTEGQFDVELVSIFLKQIALFPNGSMVQLSNGDIALVERQNKNMPLRPVVRVFQKGNGNKVKPYHVNLMEDLSITILQSELELQDGKNNLA